MKDKVKSRLDALSNITISRDKDPKTAGITAPVSATIMMALQRDEAVAEANAAKEALARLEASQNIPLDLLVEVPGRRRKLSDQEYEELKANLRQHPLSVPITVRALPDGKFEIISGYNRVAIYKELREEDPEKFGTIKAWATEQDDETTEELAFYANLLQPELPPYEKYVGFKRIMARNPDVQTVTDLSRHTGINRSVVSMIMRLDEIPAEALQLIEQHPKAIGYHTFSALAAASQEGQAQEVIEVVRKMIEKGLEQNQAIDLLKTISPEKKQVGRPKSTKPAPVEYKIGKTMLSRFVRAEKRIAITFKSEADAAEVEEAVKSVLEQQAKRREQGN